MKVNYGELVKQFAANPNQAGRNLREAIENRDFVPHDFEFGPLFEVCFGWHEYKRCQRKEVMVTDLFESRRVTESPGAVSTAQFMNITGQIFYSAVLDRYETEDTVFSKAIPTKPTRFLDGEKIAGVTNIGDEATVRNEGDPYTIAGLGEDWIFTPPPKDRGKIIPLTFEAVFADRTGQLLDQATRHGEYLGINKEKRAVNCLIDENVTTHRYNWRGTTIASYNDNTGTHTWDNLVATNALADWTDVDNAEQALNAITDPYTGEPAIFKGKHLIVAKQLEKTAMRIRNATEIVTVTPGFATSGDPNRTKWNNPYSGMFDVLSTRYVAAQMATDTNWFYGDITKYAAYMQIEPLTTVQAPANNEDEFNNRIVAKYRVNEWGAYVVVQPRAIIKSTVA